MVASWVQPDDTLSGDPTKLDVPGDFPLSANAAEAVLLSVADNSSLHYSGTGGGNIKLALEVFDWGSLKPGVKVPDTVHRIVVEGDSSVIPGGFATFDHSALAPTASPGTSSISSVFQVEIDSCTPQSASPVPLLITVENKKPGSLRFRGDGHNANSDRLASYFRHSVPVGGTTPGSLKVISPNGGETLWMAITYQITWDPGLGGIQTSNLNGRQIILFPTSVRLLQARRIPEASCGNPSRLSRLQPPKSGSATCSAQAPILPTIISLLPCPVWLYLKPEVTITGTNVNWNEGPVGFPSAAERISPAITQNTDSSVFISFYYWTYSYETYDSYLGSIDGASWAGSTGYYNTGCWPLDIIARADSNKAAPTADGHTVEGIAFYIPGIDEWWAGQYPKPPSSPGNYWVSDGLQADFGNGKFAEMGSDAAGYAYFFADNMVSNSIYVRKTSQPGLICMNPDCTQLEPSSTQITTDGLVSHSRSYARQGQGISLIYYTSSGEVMIVETTDAPTNNTWDVSETVWDGAGYTGTNSSTICTDSTGRLFAAWTARRTSDNKYVILASMRSTPSSSWTTPCEVASGSAIFSDINISSKSVLLPGSITSDVAVVAYETGGTTSATLSPLDLMAFLPKQDVSATGVTTQEPDVMAWRDISRWSYICIFMA